MKKRKEFLAAKRIAAKCEELNTWPGCPWGKWGAVDFKTKDYWISNIMKYKVADENWKNFAVDFQRGMVYQILDCMFITKGNWLVNAEMANYRKFLDADWSEKDTNYKGEEVTSDNFYIDNQNLVRLYFAVWAAIREYKNTDKVMVFIHDQDNDYTDVLIFNNLEEANQYYKDYVTGE